MQRQSDVGFSPARTPSASGHSGSGSTKAGASPGTQPEPEWLQSGSFTAPRDGHAAPMSSGLSDTHQSRDTFFSPNAAPSFAVPPSSSSASQSRFSVSPSFTHVGSLSLSGHAPQVDRGEARGAMNAPLPMAAAAFPPRFAPPHGASGGDAQRPTLTSSAGCEASTSDSWRMEGELHAASHHGSSMSETFRAVARAAHAAPPRLPATPYDGQRRVLSVSDADPSDATPLFAGLYYGAQAEPLGGGARLSPHDSWGEVQTEGGSSLEACFAARGDAFDTVSSAPLSATSVHLEHGASAPSSGVSSLSSVLGGREGPLPPSSPPATFYSSQARLLNRAEEAEDEAAIQAAIDAAARLDDSSSDGERYEDEEEEARNTLLCTDTADFNSFVRRVESVGGSSSSVSNSNLGAALDDTTAGPFAGEAETHRSFFGGALGFDLRSSDGSSAHAHVDRPAGTVGANSDGRQLMLSQGVDDGHGSLPTSINTSPQQSPSLPLGLREPRRDLAGTCAPAASAFPAVTSPPGVGGVGGASGGTVRRTGVDGDTASVRSTGSYRDPTSLSRVVPPPSSAASPAATAVGVSDGRNLSPQSLLLQPVTCIASGFSPGGTVAAPPRARTHSISAATLTSPPVSGMSQQRGPPQGVSWQSSSGAPSGSAAARVVTPTGGAVRARVESVSGSQVPVSPHRSTTAVTAVGGSDGGYSLTPLSGSGTHPRTFSAAAAAAGPRGPAVNSLLSSPNTQPFQAYQTPAAGQHGHQHSAASASHLFSPPQAYAGTVSALEGSGILSPHSPLSRRGSGTTTSTPTLYQLPAATQQQQQQQQQQQVVAGYTLTPLLSATAAADAATSSIQSSRASRNLYFRNLPRTWNTRVLRELCSAYGVVMSAKVAHHPVTNESLGYGFVLFETTQSAAVCVATLNHAVVRTEGAESRTLLVRMAHPSAAPGFQEDPEEAATAAAGRRNSEAEAAAALFSPPQPQSAAQLTSPQAGGPVSRPSAAAVSGGAGGGVAGAASASPTSAAAAAGGFTPTTTVTDLTSYATAANPGGSAPLTPLSASGPSGEPRKPLLRPNAPGSSRDGVRSRKGSFSTGAAPGGNSSDMSSTSSLFGTALSTPINAPLQLSGLLVRVPSGEGIGAEAASGTGAHRSQLQAPPLPRHQRRLSAGEAFQHMGGVLASPLSLSPDTDHALPSPGSGSRSTTSPLKHTSAPAPAASPSNATSTRNLYVTNLPLSWNTTRLRELCGQFGTIISANVAHHATTNVSRGYGFVLFAEEQDAAACVRGLHQYRIPDTNNVLSCRFAKDKATPSIALANSPASDTSPTAQRARAARGLHDPAKGDGSGRLSAAGGMQGTDPAAAALLMPIEVFSALQERMHAQATQYVAQIRRKLHEEGRGRDDVMAPLLREAGVAVGATSSSADSGNAAAVQRDVEQLMRCCVVYGANVPREGYRGVRPMDAVQYGRPSPQQLRLSPCSLSPGIHSSIEGSASAAEAARGGSLALPVSMDLSGQSTPSASGTSGNAAMQRSAGSISECSAESYGASTQVVCTYAIPIAPTLAAFTFPDGAAVAAAAAIDAVSATSSLQQRSVSSIEARTGSGAPSQRGTAVSLHSSSTPTTSSSAASRSPGTGAEQWYTCTLFVSPAAAEAFLSSAAAASSGADTAEGMTMTAAQRPRFGLCDRVLVVYDAPTLLVPSGASAPSSVSPGRRESAGTPTNKDGRGPHGVATPPQHSQLSSQGRDVAAALAGLTPGPVPPLYDVMSSSDTMADSRRSSGSTGGGGHAQPAATSSGHAFMDSSVVSPLMDVAATSQGYAPTQGRGATAGAPSSRTGISYPLATRNASVQQQQQQQQYFPSQPVQEFVLVPTGAPPLTAPAGVRLTPPEQTSATAFASPYDLTAARHAAVPPEAFAGAAPATFASYAMPSASAPAGFVMIPVSQVATASPAQSPGGHAGGGITVLAHGHPQLTQTGGAGGSSGVGGGGATHGTGRGGQSPPLPVFTTQSGPVSAAQYPHGYSALPTEYKNN